jgi:hypothetical protein
MFHDPWSEKTLADQRFRDLQSNAEHHRTTRRLRAHKRLRDAWRQWRRRG